MLLKPLGRRRAIKADRQAIATALERLDDRTLGNAVLPEIARAAKDERRLGNQPSWRDPTQVLKQLALTEALYMSRRISRSMYVYFASSPVESINEARCFEGEFDDELWNIKQAIEAIDKQSGLRPNQYWPRGQAPDEFRDQYDLLEKEYCAVIERRFITALREFGLDDLANLRQDSREEFERLRERGRRSLHHESENILALKDIVVRHEEDASRAASAKAYGAGVILLGAGLEGLLLMRCLRSKKKAMLVASALPRRQRPQSPDDPTKWTFETLISTCLSAGWLPRISTKYGHYDPGAIADILRNMRNLVHPGRCVRETPWSETDERDFRDAEGIYVTLRTRLLGRRSLTDTAS